MSERDKPVTEDRSPGTPINEYDPELSEHSYAVIARIIDDVRAKRAAARIASAATESRDR